MRHWKWLSLITCFAVFGFSFVISPAYGQIKPIELNYSIFFPAPHKNAVLAGEWAKEIEKRTDGKVKITMFYGGTLTPADKCYDGVVKGISDIGFSVFQPLLSLARPPDRYRLGDSAGLRPRCRE